MEEIACKFKTLTSTYSGTVVRAVEVPRGGILFLTKIIVGNGGEKLKKYN